MVEKVTVRAGELWRFRLDHENPRHEPQSQQQDIIDYLTANEDVIPLLEDIAAQKSLNPFDRFGAVRSGDFLVAIEGNRRLCSLILLSDPDLAPAKYRARVKDAAAGWQPELIDIDVAIFDTREEADPWIERRHQGALAGRGLRQWSPAAKDRHFGTSSNALALRLLSDGVAKNLITAEQGASRVVTTVRRFTEKESFRAGFLGITTGRSEENYVTDPPASVFEERLRGFFDELFVDEPTVTSRMSANDIANWVDARLAMPSVASSGAPKDGREEHESSPGDNNASGQKGSEGASTGTSAETDMAAALPQPPRVSRPAGPTARATLVDGLSFPDSSTDPMRQYFIYELARIRKETPLAATLVARVLLESIYLDLWESLPQKGKADSKLHTKVLGFIPDIKSWGLDRRERGALDALRRSAENSGFVLSPASMGAAAHGAALPAWDSLVKEWDVLLPIIRRIMKYVEAPRGQNLS